jgi:hypothetical protein
VKLQHLVSKQEVEDIVLCKDGAIAKFMRAAYECLTSRKLPQTTVPLPLDVDDSAAMKIADSKSTVDYGAQGYAAPTASTAVRNAMRGQDNDAATGLASQHTIGDQVGYISLQADRSRMALEELNTHSEFAKQERERNPARFVPKPMGESRAMTQVDPVDSEEAPMPAVEVQVRTLQTESIAELRREKERSALEMDRSKSEAGMGRTRREYAEPPSVLEIFSNSILTKLGTSAGGALDAIGASGVDSNSRSRIFALITAVKRDEQESEAIMDVDPDIDFTKESLACVLEHAGSKMVLQSLRAAAFASPKEFFLALSVVIKVVDEFSFGTVLSDHRNLAQVAVDLLVALGQAMVTHNKDVTSSLFREFGLPHVKRLIDARRPSGMRRREAGLTIFYGFYKETCAARIDALRDLQGIVGPKEKERKDCTLMIECLSLLADMENNMSENMVDLYLYYWTIGRSSQSPPVRACALSIVASVAKHDPETVLARVFPDLHDMVQAETWWETIAQIVCLCCNLLSQNRSQGPGK